MNRGQPNPSKQLIGEVLDILSSPPSAGGAPRAGGGEAGRDGGERLLEMLVKARDDLAAARLSSSNATSLNSLHKLVEGGSIGGSGAKASAKTPPNAYGADAATVLSKKNPKAAAAAAAAAAASAPKRMQRAAPPAKLSEFINKK